MADAADARLGLERDHLSIGRQPVRARCARIRLLSKGEDAAALRRVIAETGMMRHDNCIRFSRAANRQNLGRQPGR